jgi:hypothetical protein
MVTRSPGARPSTSAARPRRARPGGSRRAPPQHAGARDGVLADARHGGVPDRAAPRGPQRAHHHVGAVGAGVAVGLVGRVGAAVRAEHAGHVEVGGEPAEEVVSGAEAHAQHRRRQAERVDGVLRRGCAACGRRAARPPRRTTTSPRPRGRRPRRGPTASALRRHRRGVVFEAVVADPAAVPRTEEHGVGEAGEARVGRRVVAVPRARDHPPPAHRRPLGQRVEPAAWPEGHHREGHVLAHARLHRARRPHAPGLGARHHPERRGLREGQRGRQRGDQPVSVDDV